MSGISNEPAGNESPKTTDAALSSSIASTALDPADLVRLADGVFHDVNNMLLVMYYACQQLLSDMPADDLNRTQIAIIDNARVEAVNLIRQFRSRNQTNLRHRTIADLNNLVRQVESQLRPLASENLILSVCLTDQPTLVAVDTDGLSRLLYQVVLRAMNNAITGGWVMIETSIEQTTFTGGSVIGQTHQVRLIVTDTGADQNGGSSTAFDSADAGGDSEQSDQVPVFIRQFVAQYGGRIEQKQFQESGTRLEITLPSSITEPARPTAQAVRSESLRGNETILLVEDDLSLRKLIQSTLVSHGYRVIEAENGASAMTKAFEHTDQLHLLLTDVRIPGISGQELADRLRDEYPGLRALFISGGLDIEAITDPTTVSPSRFLAKPFRAEDLLTNVRELLDHLR